jgi:hypothetical protein
MGLWSNGQAGRLGGVGPHSHTASPPAVGMDQAIRPLNIFWVGGSFKSNTGFLGKEGQFH